MLYKERSEKKRQKYLDLIKPLSPENLIFVDESGIDSFLNRDYARSKRGQPVLAEKSGKRFARESFVAGLHKNKVVAPICYQGTMDSTLFNFWLSNFLLPEVGKGKTIIMDNAAFHKSQETQTIINDAGCQLIFLPPYSPDFNPIEKFWANLKRHIRNTLSQFDSLQNAIDCAFQGTV